MTVTDLSLPPQVSRSSEIDSTLDELIEWQRLQWNLSDEPTREEIEVMNVELPQWRLWIHTHPGGTSYSSKDVETLARLASEMTGDWMVGLCINKKLEHTVYIGGANPAPHCAVIMDSGIETLRVQNDDFAEMFHDRVEKYSYSAPQKVHHGFPGTQNWGKKTHSVDLEQSKDDLTKASQKRNTIMAYETSGFYYELRAEQTEELRECFRCGQDDHGIWGTMWKRPRMPDNSEWKSVLGPSFVCIGCGERSQVCTCAGSDQISRALIDTGMYGVYGV